MIQLNLLPDLKKEFIKAQKNKALIISISLLTTMGALGLSVLLFLYVTFGQQVQIDLVTNDIKNKTAKLREVHDINKYLTIQNQLSSIPTLHANKGAFSRLFTFLGVLNPAAPNNANLTNLQAAEEDKSIAFTGTTASFETLNNFVDTLKNAEVVYTPAGSSEALTEKMFKDVLLQSSGITRQGNNSTVGFTVKAYYNDQAFNATNSNVTAKVPSIITTGSVTGSPTPLFNGEAQ